MILNGFGAYSYTGTEKVELMKFQCTVDSDAAVKNYEVKLIDLVADDENYETKNPTCKPATITVTGVGKPATGLSLNKTAVTIYTGNSEQLQATVTPADSTDAITWKSGNPGVATVDNTGKVTAVAPGTAVITAKAGSKSATCNVKVTNTPCSHANISTVTGKDSTCSDQGWDDYKKCNDCGQLFDTSGKTISAVPFRSLKDHTGGKATCTDRAVCSVCSQSYGDPAPGHTLKAVKAVSATYEKAGRKAYYKCSACQKLYGDAKATKEVTYASLTVKKKTAPVTALDKVTAKKKALTVKWKKKSGVTGYQIQVSTKKNFKSSVKTVTVNGAKKTSVTVKKLKAKKTYYVRIRTYKKVGKKTYYSAWSSKIQRKKTK